MRKTLPAEAMANWLESEIKAFNQTAENILADIDKYSSPQACRDAAKRHHTHAHEARLILSEVNKWRDGEHPHIFDYHKAPTDTAGNTGPAANQGAIDKREHNS